MPRVTFLPGRRRTEVDAGTTVHEAARQAGVPLASPCGGRGHCGRCAVEVRGRSRPPTEIEQRFLSQDDLAAGRRLACQVRVDGDLEVSIPESSRAVFAEVLSDGECVAFPLEPAVRCHEIVLEEPSLGDNASDLARLARGPLSHVGKAELGALRSLPSVLRENGLRAKALVRDTTLLGVFGPDEPVRTLGAAFDIGTTTVAGSVLDLATGELLGVASRTNPQHALGDDVVSRMDFAAGGPRALDDLRSRIVDCLNDMLDELCRGAGADARDVYDVTVAGNTVMTHLFLGLPPEAMATVPFVPVVTDSVSGGAGEVGLKASALARVWTAPACSAYVGGDVVAGLVAAGFGGLTGETVFIDVGTNGEVVVKNSGGSGERALCTATAAGPAFEGARISCGMRAVPGAITHARLEEGELTFEVAGGGSPSGLCGTGLVDVVAILLETRLIDPTGRMDPGPGGPLASRVREGELGLEIVLFTGEEREVVLTQRDVRELQLAKGAIATGVAVLLEEIGIAPAEVGRVLLAGAFGSTIDARNAVRIGLLPEGIEPGRVHAVGNTAAAGARAALASRSARREASRLAGWLRPVELSLHARFQTLFADSMLFPGESPVGRARLAARGGS